MDNDLEAIVKIANCGAEEVANAIRHMGGEHFNTVANLIRSSGITRNDLNLWGSFRSDLAVKKIIPDYILDVIENNFVTKVKAAVSDCKEEELVNNGKNQKQKVERIDEMGGGGDVEENIEHM
jgi:hypothetical protein